MYAIAGNKSHSMASARSGVSDLSVVKVSSQPLSAIRIRVGRSEALDFSFRQCDRDPDHVIERSSQIESSFVTRAAEGVRDRDACVDARSGGPARVP